MEAHAAPEPAVAYPMSAADWTMEPAAPWVGAEAGSAKFARYEGMPTGTMTLNAGVAVSRGARFSEGVIEFDEKPLGYNDAGVIFHRQGADEGEFLYLRANPDCPAADDCIQYAPITHGLMGWNIYPNHQGPAQISTTGWNHVRLLVTGDSLRVYINRASAPALVVPRMRGLTADGGIGFKGPAVYANLVVTPGNAPASPPLAREAVAAGTVTRWLAAPPTPYDRARPVTVEDAPPAADWKPVQAEPTGLVNLGRAFRPLRAPSLSMGWLKTTVVASAAMRRTLQVGFATQGRVFLNGRLVYQGDNSYYPEADRLSPDGRLEADNASIPLDLRQGPNEIVLAIGNDWRSHDATPKPSPYGWAAEARFVRADGLKLP